MRLLAGYSPVTRRLLAGYSLVWGPRALLVGIFGFTELKPLSAAAPHVWMSMSISKYSPGT